MEVRVKNFTFGSPEHLEHCISITGAATKMVLGKLKNNVTARNISLVINYIDVYENQVRDLVRYEKSN